MTSSNELIRQAKGRTDALRREPRQAMAVVTCMDARLDPLRALGLFPGDAHVIRNAGGLVTADAIRSLIVSQRLLGTNAVTVMMHTDCVLLGLDEVRLRNRMAADTTGVGDVELGSFDDAAAALRRGVQSLRANRMLPSRDRIRGVLYDIASRRTEVVVP